MFKAYIEYINSNNEISTKQIGFVSDILDLVKIIFGDDYILEYMYMPQAILIVKKNKKIIAKYEIGKLEDKLALISKY